MRGSIYLLSRFDLLTVCVKHMSSPLVHVAVSPSTACTPSLYVFSKKSLTWTESPLQTEGFCNLQWMPRTQNTHIRFEVQHGTSLFGWLKVESCLSWIHHGYYSFVLNPFFLLESTFLAPVCFSPPFFFINPPLFLIKSSMFPWQKVLGLLVVWIPHLAKSGTRFLVQTINDCEAIPPCFLHEPYDTLAPPYFLVMLSKSFVLLGELPLFVGGL